MQFEGKVCLIAGGSGAIGAAVAEKFYEEGATLAVTYLSRRAPLSTVENGRSIALELDITDIAQVQQRTEDIQQKFGRIDVLVNCTGILGPVGPTSNASVEQWARTLDINLLGAFYLTRAVLGGMVSRRKGKIIHFSGGGAAYGRPFYSAYSCSKAALVRFVESVAEEVRDHNIDVNAIAPGPVESRMWEELRKVAPPDEKTRAELKKMDESGGVSPRVAADLAVFLASERSNGLSGKLISAVWDEWSGFDQRIDEIMNSEAGTLRRVPLT